MGEARDPVELVDREIARDRCRPVAGHLTVLHDAEERGRELPVDAQRHVDEGMDRGRHLGIGEIGIQPGLDVPDGRKFRPGALSLVVRGDAVLGPFQHRLDRGTFPAAFASRRGLSLERTEMVEPLLRGCLGLVEGLPVGMEEGVRPAIEQARHRLLLALETDVELGGGRQHPCSPPGRRGARSPRRAGWTRTPAGHRGPAAPGRTRRWSCRCASPWILLFRSGCPWLDEGVRLLRYDQGVLRVSVGPVAWCSTPVPSRCPARAGNVRTRPRRPAILVRGGPGGGCLLRGGPFGDLQIQGEVDR